MSYQVDYTVLEWWSTYATCPHEQFANEIAAMLIARGETVRVSEIQYDMKLGPTQTPKAAGVGEQSSDSEPRHSPTTPRSATAEAVILCADGGKAAAE